MQSLVKMPGLSIALLVPSSTDSDFIDNMDVTFDRLSDNGDISLFNGSGAIADIFLQQKVFDFKEDFDEVTNLCISAILNPV